MIDACALLLRLNAVGGGSQELDQAISDFFEQPAGAYTESVSLCRSLVARVLPQWHLHLGYDVSGVLPYASLSLDQRYHHAEAPTVPLAILRVLLTALIPAAGPGRSKPRPV
ncbi:hypothetical protein [Magnetospirillum sulfuroxidans]|uniref:Uncharacterized protein n=1 Tax=Magnetospirillum sulfuroxidans TaxID=611300 RepID=A0ABS5I7Q1_9PROT|nr:hypothetical protein [Magnetospirillum sulfuroxidans]MBR9970449.1 hypothetical protein [Magnetospirillum sulfuroxidans]